MEGLRVGLAWKQEVFGKCVRGAGSTETFEGGAELEKSGEAVGGVEGRCEDDHEGVGPLEESSQEREEDEWLGDRWPDLDPPLLELVG
jgi:hypothetical protein